MSLPRRAKLGYTPSVERPVALLLLGACACGDGISLSRPAGPVVLGAEYRLEPRNRRLRCDSNLDCGFIGVRIIDVSFTPRGVFEPLDPAEPGRLRAVGRGVTKITARGLIEGDEIEGEVEVEVAEAARVSLRLPDGFKLDRFVGAPGSQFSVLWSATDNQGRALIGDRWLAAIDPTGLVAVEAEDGPTLRVELPEREGTARLVDPRGAAVAEVQVDASARPDRLDVVFLGERGPEVAVRVVGRTGADALLFSPISVALTADVPNVCRLNQEGPLGQTAFVEVFGPGRCRVTARASLPEGQVITGDGEGRVGLPIERARGGRR